MAQQTGLIKFTGKLDNLIGYRRNGKHFLRTMPARVRQTAATRQASRNFGVASRRGSLVRRAFAPLLDVRRDGTFVNRLNKTLIQSGIQGMKGYRFNQHAGLEKFFHLSPVFTEQGVLRIPAQELPSLPKTTHLEVRAIAVRINFAERRITGTASTAMMIDASQPFEGAELDISLQGKGTLILVLQVRAYHGTMARGNRQYMAADVIAVQLAGKPRKPAKERPPFRREPLHARAGSLFVAPATGPVQRE